MKMALPLCGQHRKSMHNSLSVSHPAGVRFHRMVMHAISPQASVGEAQRRGAVRQEQVVDMGFIHCSGTATGIRAECDAGPSPCTCVLWSPALMKARD